MAFNTLKMALKVWDQLADPYNHTQLADNWSKIDQHDHTPGRGVQLNGGAIVDGAIQARHIADGVLNTGLNPAAVTTLPTTGLTDGLIVPWKPAITANYGITWMMRYDAAAPTYKWECVGGEPLISTHELSYSVPVGFGSPTWNIQDFVLPYTGQWTLEVDIGYILATPNSNGYFGAIAIRVGSDTNFNAIYGAQFSNPGIGSSDFGQNLSRRRSTICQGGNSVGMRTSATAAATGYGAFFSVKPVNVTG
jgi:hypothetical protein